MIRILIILSFLIASCSFRLQVYEEPKTSLSQAKNSIAELTLESSSPKKITKRFENLLINADIALAEMYITNDSSCNTGGVWEPLVLKKENWDFLLPESSGIVNVYVKFKKENGVETDCQTYSFDFENALFISINSPANGITSVGYDVYHGSCVSGTTVTVESAEITNLPKPVLCDGEFHIGVPFKSSTTGIKNFKIVSTDSNGVRKSISYSVNYQPSGINSGIGFDKDTMDGYLDSTINKIYIVGGFKTYNGITHDNIIRFNLDGSVDTTFASLAFDSYSWIYDIAVDEVNQKVYLAGDFTTYGGLAATNIIRLNADGSRDLTFTPTAPNSIVYNIVLDSANSRIYIGGDFTNYAGTGNKGIARLNLNGSVDNTFLTSGTGFDSSVYTITVDSSLNRIWVTGGFERYNNILQPVIARLNMNGTLDTDFVSEMSNYGNVHTLIKIPSLNQIWVASEWGSFNNGSSINLASFNLYGNKTAPWNVNWNPDGACFDLKYESVNNHVYALGGFSGLETSASPIYQSDTIMKVNLDGTPVKRFQAGNGSSSNMGWWGNMIMDYSNRRIYIVGEVNEYNWEVRKGLVVIDMDDGSLK